MAKVAINKEAEANKADKRPSKADIHEALELLETCCIMTAPSEWEDFGNNKKVAVKIIVPPALAELLEEGSDECNCGIFIDFFVTGLVIDGIRYRATRKLREKLEEILHPPRL